HDRSRLTAKGGQSDQTLIACRARRPVDGVLEQRGHGSIIFGRDEQHPVLLEEMLLERERAWRKRFFLERLRIYGQVERREIERRHPCTMCLEPRGREPRQRLIIRPLARAADDYRNLCHCSS